MSKLTACARCGKKSQQIRRRCRWCRTLIHDCCVESVTRVRGNGVKRGPANVPVYLCRACSRSKEKS